MFLCGFNMAPHIPRTSVFSLKSTLGLSFLHKFRLDLLKVGGIQSYFSVSGSTAEA